MNINIHAPDKAILSCSFCGGEFEYPLPIQPETVGEQVAHAILGAHRDGHNFGLRRTIEMPMCPSEWVPGTYPLFISSEGGRGLHLELDINRHGSSRVSSKS
jgi:hypothetical protein